MIDYAIRIEFQTGGSPHAHCVIWVRDASQYGVDDDSSFIEQYVSCMIPKEDGKLKDLVLLLQQHKHSSHYRRNKGCCFKCSWWHPRQANDAVASEPSICSENQDYTRFFPCRGEHVRTYISGSRCAWWQKTTNRYTHTHMGQLQ